MPLSGELGLGLIELLLDRRLARPQRRDLAGELVDLRVVARDLGRQDALLLLRVIELGLLGVELLVQVLGGGAGDQREADHEGGESDGDDRHAPAGGAAHVLDRACHGTRRRAPM